MKKVYKSNCINVVRKNQLIYCLCDVLVGLLDTFGEHEFVSFVREVLFRPHTTYTQHCILIEENVEN